MSSSVATNESANVSAKEAANEAENKAENVAANETAAEKSRKVGKGAHGGASSSPPRGGGGRLTLDSIFDSRDFKSESYSRPRWWRVGSFYTTLDRIDDEKKERRSRSYPKEKGGVGGDRIKDGGRKGGGGDGAYGGDVKGTTGEEEGEEGPSPPPPSPSPTPTPRDLIWNDASKSVRSVYVSHTLLVPPGSSDPLEVDDYSLSPDRSRLLIFTNSRKVWRRKTRGDYWVLDVTARELRQLGGREARSSSLMFATFSPDGTKVCYVRENNLYVEDLLTFRISQLTCDGSSDIINGTFDWSYEEEFSLRRGFRWCPDSSRVAFWRVDQTDVKVVNLINNADYLYPRIVPVPYPKTGETNPSVRIGVVGADGGGGGGGTTTWLDLPGSDRDNYVADLGWVESEGEGEPGKSGGGGEIYLQRLNRLQNTVHVMLADPTTGATRTIFTDMDDAWLDLRAPLRWLRGGRSFLWLSERNGWRQLFKVTRLSVPDSESAGDGGGEGEARMTALTPPTFDVCSVCGADEDDGDGDGWAYYTASPSDPVRRYLYRSKLSASPPGVTPSMERVTPPDAPGTHSYVLSADAKFAIHVLSTFEMPDQTDIVRLPDHVASLTLADNAKIRERLDGMGEGLPRAEFFRVPICPDGDDDDDDGCDVGGAVELDAYRILPPNLDRTKKYPLLLYVYGEPAMQVVRDTWTGRSGLWHRMLAQRGYVVMCVDNRGTPSPRGREWRKCVHRKIGILASEDQAEAVRRILGDMPYLDRGRVAVWGWSGGGSMSLNAIFRHPDLYGTAMAVAPVPNQRGYDTIYQERYMGLPSDNVDGYRDGSPIAHAHKLRGSLLLVHGTGDDNCHYAGTEALINELIRHGKRFEMMAYPNRSHSISEGSGTTRHLFGLLTAFLERNCPPNRNEG